MLFLVFVIAVFCVFLNFGFSIVNEEFIVGLVLTFFMFSLLIFLKRIFAFYFCYQKEKIYFLFSYLITLNVNLLEKIITYINLIQCRSIYNILELYDFYFFYATLPVHTTYTRFFCLLRYNFLHFVSLAYSQPACRLPAKLNFTYHFYLVWLEYIESLDLISDDDDNSDKEFLGDYEDSEEEDMAEDMGS